MKPNLLGLPPTLHYGPSWKAVEMAVEKTRSPTCLWLPSSNGVTGASHYDQTYYHIEIGPLDPSGMPFLSVISFF